LLRLNAFLHRGSIRKRILLTFVSVVVGGAFVQLAVAGLQLQDSTFEYYRSRLQAHGQDLAAVMAEPLEHYLAEDDNEALNRVIAALQGDPYNAFLIFDDQLDLIGSTLTATVDQFGVLTPELAGARDTGIGFEVRKNGSGEENLYVAVPIRYETAYLGFLVVSDDMQPIRTEMMSDWIKLGASLLPVIAGIVGVGLWIASSIARPLRDLRVSALKMAGGDLTVRTQIQSGDEIGALGKAFNTMAEKLSILIRAQKDFVSNAAHELRTPLMTSALRIEALSEPVLEESQRQVYLNELREEMRHMAELVEALLTLSRLDEGRWDVGEAFCDSVSVLHDSAREWRKTAGIKRVKLILDIPKDLPDAALPATDLRLIFDNLLGNAVKYTNEGTVRVQGSLRGTMLHVRIIDTGIGFTPEDGERLFERFFRADSVRFQHLSGTGLGLAVAQTLAAHWGGTMTASSDGPGCGAIFTVSLPVVKAQQSALNVEPARA
jgi:signal transduction histidine kinase